MKLFHYYFQYELKIIIFFSEIVFQFVATSKNGCWQFSNISDFKLRPVVN